MTANILEKLKNLEISLMSPGSKSGFLSIEKLISDRFIEFGSSGKIYDKSTTLEILRTREASRSASDCFADNFECTSITEDVYLLTYILKGKNGNSLRSSIWEKSTGHWQIVFHQGTIVKE